EATQLPDAPGRHVRSYFWRSAAKPPARRGSADATALVVGLACPSCGQLSGNTPAPANWLVIGNCGGAAESAVFCADPALFSFAVPDELSSVVPSSWSPSEDSARTTGSRPSLI